MPKIKELFKKLLGICILTPLLYNFCNAENYIENGIWRMSINNNETDYWTGKITKADNDRYTVNDYGIQNIGNGNWKTYYNNGTYNNIFYVQSTNVPPQYAWRGIFFWNTDNTINYSFGTNYTQAYTENKIVRPLKMYHSTPNDFISGVKNVNNYTYNINDFYNLTGNIEDIIIGVGSDRDRNQFTSVQEGLFLCFNVDNTDIYCVSCDNSGGGNNDWIRCKGGFNTGYVMSGIESWSINDYENLIGESAFSTNNEGGATPYCPPIRFEIDMYGYKYNTGLCYSNTEEITGGEITTVTPITIFEAFPTYENYVQAYNLITQNCHTDTVNTVEECRTALQAIGKKPAQILLKLINSNIPEGTSIAKVYQYCHLQLDYTEEEKRNTSTCELKEEETFYATGITQNNSSNPNTLEYITDALKESQEIPLPEDGTIFDNILPDGVITWKSVVFNMDFMEHFTKLFSKITTMFLTRQEKPGILPGAITSLLLLIVLFKIYKK